MDWVLFIRIVITIVWFLLPIITVASSYFFWRSVRKDIRKIKRMEEVESTTPLSSPSSPPVPPPSSPPPGQDA